MKNKKYEIAKVVWVGCKEEPAVEIGLNGLFDIRVGQENGWFYWEHPDDAGNPVRYEVLSRRVGRRRAEAWLKDRIMCVLIPCRD